MLDDARVPAGVSVPEKETGGRRQKGNKFTHVFKLEF